ncbi:hypothetical protein SAMN05192574_1232 [Mucilaginibacter gossypiicola]|uniref:Uncharacterized protein n=1 Tax=Mucilaginibacter gossypiicola TaxID=551995 RepID=A0A1H8V6W5_9SPHI|nr:hypothetical protein SAMN05192574_1232 [Mucilaginibacter gossypiicola]
MTALCQQGPLIFFDFVDFFLNRDFWDLRIGRIIFFNTSSGSLAEGPDVYAMLIRYLNILVGVQNAVKILKIPS